MFVLSALCVLLPLAAALDSCDQSTADAFLAKRQLRGDILNNLANKTYWFVAASTEGSDSNVNSVEVTFSTKKDDYIVSNFDYRDASGTSVFITTNMFQWEEDHILAGDITEVYYFQCSKNLIAGYRCEVEDPFVDAYGPKFFIWAEWDKTDADVSKDIAACVAEFTKVDASATFVYRVHP